MAFDDTFRLSSHAVILNENNEVLLLKANYESFSWGLPGGALEVGETIHEALVRECLEELGQPITAATLTGVYYHKHYNSQAFIFRCSISEISKMTLSSEHSEYNFFPISSLSEIQAIRVNDCLNFSGIVTSRKF
ncbi:NUDIX hydrolase [Pseudomonas sp. URIL14HWK12:I5]|uniref:NUDIX hydrolase n=1 Tax=Pseudomonas sp. URIL14HWK12:I5 TaxID=1261630 RepID=UPI0009D90DC2|nr:NUDIX domain-containing protein [Pseudomonas sp. URIL14HWK12:I5]SMD13152.1 ADP-ribose pyrophosphatase YjhB, NUDIX family [Pseudomonas sp. URIL14HWK12:I5]